MKRVSGVLRELLLGMNPNMQDLYLLFDFDGVIGNTWDVFLEALIHNDEFKTKEEAVAAVNTYFANKPNHSKAHSLSKEELHKMSQQRIATGTFINENGFELFDDFVKEIEKFETKHKAIVSTGSLVYLEPALARTNIRPTHILGFEDHHSKEEKINQICNDWKCNIEDVYYFTDSLADVLELKDHIAKDKLIGVSWGFCSKEQLLSELAEECILDTAADMSEVLP